MQKRCRGPRRKWLLQVVVGALMDLLSPQVRQVANGPVVVMVGRAARNSRGGAVEGIGLGGECVDRSERTVSLWRARKPVGGGPVTCG